MQEWRPEVLAAIARRLGLGVAFDDLSPPDELQVRTADGLALNVLDWGGEGTPVVLAHGGSLSCRTWDYVALALRGDFRVLAPDLRGHGASDWAADYPVEGYALDILGVLDALGLESAHVGGMSLGGIASCEFALTHPARIRSLAMVDVAARVAVEASARMRSFIADFPGADSVEDVVAMAMAVSPKSDPERVDYRMRTLLRRVEDGRLAWKRDNSHANLGRIVDHLAGLEARVADFAAPFLLVRGGRSRILTPQSAADFAGRFADGRWIEVADAGHNVQEDNPRDLSAALRTFWRSVAQLEDFEAARSVEPTS